MNSDNAQGEFYLTDVLAISRAGRAGPVLAYKTSDAEQCLGVNSRGQLAEATRVMQRRINDAHMAAGVTMWDPATAYIGPEVEIGPRRGASAQRHAAGEDDDRRGQRRGPRQPPDRHARRLRRRIDETVAVEALIDDGATCGPRAYLRPAGALVRGRQGRHPCGDQEIHHRQGLEGAASVLHRRHHHGEGVNIGAGSITCNYDGANKHATVIEDGAFVGSDTMMVAPVTIGAGALVGAGSTITKDVTPGALALGRARQQEIEGWVAAHPIEKKK